MVGATLLGLVDGTIGDFLTSPNIDWVEIFSAKTSMRNWGREVSISSRTTVLIISTSSDFFIYMVPYINIM
jgi:hypothetical protein